MSKRILLVIDDFNENRRIEADLRKVGFDVVGIMTEASLSDQILAFGPDVIVCSGQSEKLSALSVAAKLKDHRSFGGSVILGFSSKVKVTSQDLLRARVDRILDLPFRMEALVQNIAQLLRMDGDQLVEKLKRFKQADIGSASSENMQIIRGGNEAPPQAENVRGKGSSRALPKANSRDDRYRQIAKQLDIDKSSTTFQKASIKEHWQEVKKDFNLDFLDELKRLKVEFARALFRKK